MLNVKHRNKTTFKKLPRNGGANGAAAIKSSQATATTIWKYFAATQQLSTASIY